MAARTIHFTQFLNLSLARNCSNSGQELVKRLRSREQILKASGMLEGSGEVPVQRDV